MTHTDNFAQMILGVQKIQASPPKQQVVSLKRLAANTERMGDDAKGKMKACYTRAYNLLTSIADGLASGEADSAELKGVLYELREIKGLATALEHSPQSTNDHAVDKTDFETRYQAENEAVIKKYAAYEQMVPRNLGNVRLKAVRVPIVCITDPILDRDRLRKFKISEDTLAGYPILKSQLVLGIDEHVVRSEFDGNMEHARDFALQRVHQKVSKQFTPIQGSVRRGSVRWIWIVDELKMKQLMKASSSGHVRVKAWSFPFEPDPVMTKRKTP